MIQPFLSACLVSSLGLTPSLPADTDWPAWRGAGQDGVAPGSPPVEFSEESNLRWRSALPGMGLSTPVVVGERVFVSCSVSSPEEPAASEAADDSDAAADGGRPPRAALTETDFLVLAFQRGDGSALWERVARTQVPHQGTHGDGSFAAPSITSDGTHLFVSFGSYGIYCYDLDGKLIWEVDLGDMDVRNAFGEGSSPVLCGESLIVLWDHEGESFLAALDKATGKERWRTARDHGTNWVTPLIVDDDDGTRIIVASGTTVAYDAATGEALWSCTGREGGGIIATPVLHEGVLVYSTGTRRGGTLFALRLDGAKGDRVHESEAVLWSNDRDAPRIPSPIVHDGILYALKSTSGILSAFDLKSGEPLYRATRLEGVADAWASPVVADGRLYVLGRDGTVEVLATGPEFESLAVNHLDDVFDASPAVAGDELYLRGRSYLYCIAEGE